jgi:hypothetical protein
VPLSLDRARALAAPLTRNYLCGRATQRDNRKSQYGARGVAMDRGRSYWIVGIVLAALLLSGARCSPDGGSEPANSPTTTQVTAPTEQQQEETQNPQPIPSATPPSPSSVNPNPLPSETTAPSFPSETP